MAQNDGFTEFGKLLAQSKRGLPGGFVVATAVSGYQLRKRPFGLHFVGLYPTYSLRLQKPLPTGNYKFKHFHSLSDLGKFWPIIGTCRDSTGQVCIADKKSRARQRFITNYND